MTPINGVQSFWDGFDFTYILSILLGVIPSLLCITLHEMSHGLVAYKLGDDTAKRQGRLSFNPLKHLDPVGLRGPRFLPQVRRWLNVYLPYTRAAWSRENNVARLGRPWEYVREANLNRVPSVLRHADALGMFREYGAAFITLSLMDAPAPAAGRPI